MMMTQELTVRLIKKVREYVFLYDHSHPKYKDLVQRHQTWEEISKELDQTSKFMCIVHL
jgi:hypothetical protein